MSLLELRNVEKSFGHTVALAGVDLKLQPGEVHALIGENGAGKSTLMNIVVGSLRPDSGELFLRGQPYAPSNPLDSRRGGIALIHQELSLAPHLTVAENILMGIEPRRFGWMDRSALRSKTLDVLSSFGHTSIRPEARVGDLSTAEQQIVEICRAIAANAEIILMDEPTSSLQRSDVERLFVVIRQLREKGIGIVYISHFLEEIREIADTFTVIRDGKTVANGYIADVKDDELVSHMVGRSVNELFPKRFSAPTDEVVMSVADLAAPPELRDASLTLRRGEIFGIAGLVGAGRTRMLRTLFGLERPTSGSIAVNGKTLHVSGPSSRILSGFGYLSEDRKREGLALKLSTADNMTMTRFSSCSTFGWLRRGEQFRQADNLRTHVGVRGGAVTLPVENLSGGNQQKVAVARLVHQRADVLLLDEPTRGIDIGSRETIYRTIADLADQGHSVLMVSSYLPELFGICDRLAVMTRGRLGPARPINDWTPELAMQAAIAGGMTAYDD